jgi:hypothetical protein
MLRVGLCFRCEHRARFFETEAAPRCECGNTDLAVGSCYMYTPVKPLTIQRLKGDRRPITLNVLSARVAKSPKQMALRPSVQAHKKDILVYWEPAPITIKVQDDRKTARSS